MGSKKTNIVWQYRMPSHLQSQFSVGDLGVTGVDGQRSGKLDKRSKSRYLVLIHVCVLVCVLVCGSTHGSGCMVDGGSTMTAI